MCNAASESGCLTRCGIYVDGIEVPGDCRIGIDQRLRNLNFTWRQSLSRVKHCRIRHGKNHGTRATKEMMQTICCLSFSVRIS